MKNKILSILLALVLIFSMTAVYATEIPNIPDGIVSEEDVPTLTTFDDVDEIINTPLVSTNTSTSLGTVKGNKVITEESVELTDTTIDGNLVIFAQTINLKNINVDGDVAIFAENVNISELLVTNGVTFIACQNANISYISTFGNIYVAAEKVNVTADAKGLYVAASELTVGTDSQITNVYNLSEEVPEEEESVVEVEVETTADIIGEKVFNVLAIVVKTALVAGFIFLFTYEFVNKLKAENNAKYLGLSTLQGIGWSIVIPVIVIILVASTVAIGVGFSLLALYVILFWASVPFVSIAIMNMVAKEEDTKWKKYGMTLCIAFALAVVKQLPGIGGLLTVIVAFAGMGIVVGSLKPAKKAKNTEEVKVAVEDKKEEVKEDKDSEENK